MRYFVSLIDAGSYTDAARRNGISQPALSQQIRALESELGGRLVESQGRELRPTPAGSYFLNRARCVVQLMDAAIASTRSAISEGVPDLAILSAAGYGYTAIPTALQRWEKAFPTGTVRWQEISAQDQLELQVRTCPGVVGVGAPISAGSDLVSVDLGSEEFVVVGDIGMVASVIQQSQLDDLGDRNWVHVRHGRLPDFDIPAIAANLRQNARYHVDRYEDAVRLALAGAGLALVPVTALNTSPNVPRHALDPPLVRPVVAFAASWVPFLEFTSST